MRGRPTIVALEGSFHGRTVATLAATGQPAKRAPFEPLLDWFRFVPPGDLDALDAALAPGDVGAVLLEPVLGEGGVMPLGGVVPPWCREPVRRRRARCWSLDEVQAGSGRAGDWLSIEAAGRARPTSSPLAKALGGGLPIGALVARADLAFGPGEHGSTFGGGPVPCAAALAVLDEIEDERTCCANVRAMGGLLRAEVARLAPAGALVGHPGRGLPAGLRARRGIAAADVVAALRGRGVLASHRRPRRGAVHPAVHDRARRGRRGVRRRSPLALRGGRGMSGHTRSRTRRHADDHRAGLAERLGSQEEIRARLAELGQEATQSTISRDLEELGLARVHDARRPPVRRARSAVVASRRSARCVDC